MLVERLDQPEQLLALLVVDGDRVLRLPDQRRLARLAEFCFQRFRHVPQLVLRGEDLVPVLARDNVVRARLDRRLQHGVGARDLRVVLDHADMIEHEGDRACFGEVAARLGEGGAHLAGGAVAVVGQDLDHDRNAAGAVALVADLVVVLSVATQRLLDRAVDVVLRHVLHARCDHRRPQPRVHRRIRHAELGGHGDFARELAEQLGFGRILSPLAVHDVLELGMAGHRSLLVPASPTNAPRAQPRDRRILGEGIDFRRL